MSVQLLWDNWPGSMSPWRCLRESLAQELRRPWASQPALKCHSSAFGLSSSFLEGLKLQSEVWIVAVSVGVIVFSRLLLCLLRFLPLRRWC